MAIEINYEGHSLTLESGETVLDACERAGIVVPSSCRSGICQFCLMKSTSGKIPKKSQQGIRESLQKTGHFLSCICRPTESMVCESANSSSFRGDVVIEEIFEIGLDIVTVRFAKPPSFCFSAGQFATFQIAGLPPRSYSLVPNRQDASTFDIHVRKIDKGRMSTWFHETALPREKLHVEGPRGECIYYPEHPDENLLLVGTGTGLAPLYAIAEDALLRGHRGIIRLIQGALSEERLYLTAEIEQLSEKFPNLEYSATVVKKPFSRDIGVGDVQDIALNELANLTNVRAYLCGDPGLVRRLKKQFFLKGLSLNKIHSDPFIGTENS